MSLTEPTVPPAATVPDAALQASEQRYRALFTSMTEGLALHEMIFDASGAPCDYRFLDVNPAFERLTGLARDRVVGRTVREALPGIESDWIEVYGRVVQTGEPAHIEAFAGALGRVYEVTAYRPAPGQFVAAFLDVTERHHAAEALRESEARHRLLAETMLQGVVHQDAEGRIIAMNPAAERVLGKAPADFLGETSVSVEHDTVREDGSPFPGQEHPAMVALRTGQPVRGVVMGVFNPRERERRWIRIDAVPLFPPGSVRAHQVYTIFDDITERRRAEEALRQSERMYRAIGESIDYGVWVCAPDGRNIYASESFLKMVGLTQEQCSNFGWGDVLHPDDAERTLAAWKECVRTGGKWDIEHRFRGVDGEWHHVLARGVPVRGGDGRVVTWAGINLDITDRKRAEEELRQARDHLEERVAERTAEIQQQSLRLAELASEVTLAEHRERQRLAKVLHDQIQQLLVAAKLHAGLLKRRSQDSAVVASAHHIDDLLAQTLEATRTLTTDLTPPILHERGLGPALEWLARRLGESHGISVAVALVPEAEPADVDTRTFLFDAVRELLLNTIKHAGVDLAQVTVDRDPEGRVRVVVSDEGAGFEPDRPRAPGAVGGFGLFSIQQRLQYMGGSTVIDSAPGGGTRVTLLGPPAKSVRGRGSMQVAEVPAEVAGAEPPEPRPDSGRIRVVLADDHRILRQGLAALLRAEADLEVVGEASDGAEALDLARRLRPDVVVMDVTMPNMDGVEATGRITADVPGVRVIGLSLHETGDMAAAMKGAGAVAYLSKGGPSEALVTAIRKAAGRTGKANTDTPG